MRKRKERKEKKRKEKKILETYLGLDITDSLCSSSTSFKLMSAADVRLGVPPVFSYKAVNPSSFRLFVVERLPSLETCYFLLFFLILFLFLFLFLFLLLLLFLFLLLFLPSRAVMVAASSVLGPYPFSCSFSCASSNSQSALTLVLIVSTHVRPAQRLCW